jgi:HEAT repeat protein
MRPTRLALRLTLAASLLAPASTAVIAQHSISSADTKIVTSDSSPQAQEEPDVKAATPSQDSAWDMLTTATHKNTQSHIVALAALGTMGTNPRAARLIAEGMNDSDLDVRTAAILAAGQTKNRVLIPALRERLDDREPQAVFTAAVTLWKMHDREGEEVLKAVAAGDRKAKPGLMHGAKNDVNHELHDPAALATMGATEGASLLLGPFGFGIRAVEYMHKSGGSPARANAINLLAESHVAMRSELIDALSDKDAAVRAAAAKALGQRPDPSDLKPLGALFSDPRLPVRLTAAAAYINCSHAAAARKS